MAKADPLKIDTTVSLLVVVSTLALATVLSVVIPAKTAAKGGEQTKRLWQAAGEGCGRGKGTSRGQAGEAGEVGVGPTSRACPQAVQANKRSTGTAVLLLINSGGLENRKP